jgi:hypothetical protein
LMEMAWVIAGETILASGTLSFSWIQG